MVAQEQLAGMSRAQGCRESRDRNWGVELQQLVEAVDQLRKIQLIELATHCVSQCGIRIGVEKCFTAQAKERIQACREIRTRIHVSTFNYGHAGAWRWKSWWLC